MVTNEIVQKLIEWTREYVNSISPTINVVLGISGGKDSTVAAKVLVEAIGKERVIGVNMPNGMQSDYEDVDKVFSLLDIKRMDVDLEIPYHSLMERIEDIDFGLDLSEQSIRNILPRLRMTTLYCIAQTKNALVCNTSNKSEGLIGWCTKWGDNVGDFSLFSNFTKNEVQRIGTLLGLPDDLVYKIPADGLTGLSDDDNFKQMYGITYEDIELYLLNKLDDSDERKVIIDRLRASNMHKSKMESFTL